MGIRLKLAAAKVAGKNAGVAQTLRNQVFVVVVPVIVVVVSSW